MSQEAQASLIGHRAELLARVVLTRRLNISVHPFADGDDHGINMICTLDPSPDDKVKGFYQFAAVVWGTDKDLSTPEQATRYGRSRWRGWNRPKTTFFMPVIVLLFSMQRDDAYFAWLVEPCKDAPKLLQLQHLEFVPFDTKQLDKMIHSIRRWYERLSPQVVVADAGATDSSQCSDNEDD
jgi:hypothetical protein